MNASLSVGARERSGSGALGGDATQDVPNESEQEKTELPRPEHMSSHCQRRSAAAAARRLATSRTAPPGRAPIARARGGRKHRRVPFAGTRSTTSSAASRWQRPQRWQRGERRDRALGRREEEFGGAARAAPSQESNNVFTTGHTGRAAGHRPSPHPNRTPRPCSSCACGRSRQRSGRTPRPPSGCT